MDGQFGRFDLMQRALGDILGDGELTGPDGAVPVAWEPGRGGTLLVTGENAGGKSLLSRLLGQYLRDRAADDGRKLEWLPVSMGLRTEPGIHRAFMFGDEQSDSTGKISVRSVLGGIRTSRGRENAHVLCLDEPDIGLSEGYAAGLGDLLAAYAADLPPSSEGFVVVTHSRPIAQRLMALCPHALRVGDDLRPTASWLRDGPLPRTAADVEALPALAARRLRSVQAIINSRRAKPAPTPSAGNRR